MSKENVELARALYPGDVDLVAVLSDPDEFRVAFEPLVHPDLELRTVSRRNREREAEKASGIIKPGIEHATLDLDRSAQSST